MKLLVVGLALVAVACAQFAPASDYLPPAFEATAISNEYLAPAAAEDHTVLADDGYRYKTVRRLRNRHRRDVSELTSYLPPAFEATAPSNEYLAPAAAEEHTVLADDGYRYKTVRRLRHRHRRDVSELTSYLPPAFEATAPSNEYLAPAAAEEHTVLADDGYRYKTVRRLRHRHRRDVNELTSYLPPAFEATAPSNEYLAPAAAEEHTVLADDGYRYKTVRRLRHRHRRDVNELTSYLPPAFEATAPSNEYLAPAAAEEHTVLADDGYRYKTVRRLRHRHRRDVSELTSYLPPAFEATAPSNEYLAPAAAEEHTVLADDGYRYKTVRRLRHRHRRDVSELTSYLPPAFEATAPSNEYLAPAAAEEHTVLADDGYRYKTVRRLRHRHRRDVSELTSYLPPAFEATAPSNEYLAPAAAEEHTVLADDGYRYKTIRKLRARRH